MDRTNARLSLVCGLAVLAPFAVRQGSSSPAPAEGWSIDLATPAPHASLALSGLKDLDDLACGQCHATIAEEWALTAHANAWIDPYYQEALKSKRRPQSCYGCHIPTPLHQAPPERFGRKPRPREESQEQPRHFGVTCTSCHVGVGDEVLGPWGAETDAHASRKSEHFSEQGSNELCAACHRTTVGPVIGVARDFESARLAERGMSCVGCHMHPVERPAATDPDGRPLPARAGRSHLLQTPRDPAFLAQTFGLSVRQEADETVLTLANRAGHRVPGLADRRLQFTVVALDADGEEVARTEHSLDDVAFLPLEGTLDVRLDAVAAALKVTGLHFAPGAEQPVTFLELTLQVP